ncbi:mucin-2-like isoform X1 [Periophthalmus magnuspinnatus]|uniref:mucin-2-like isoform X1 n=1 Tax=Periophthalmus magnuspinnatus TaxID=409849 RepID=UPI002436697B|nr:mucin-2-like isoform X1 [Periophthalmus magnuspinnatus]
MMERKLGSKMFALLLLGLSALASYDNMVSTVAPESPAGPGSDLAAGPESGSSLEETVTVNVSNNNIETSPTRGFNRTTELMPLIPLNMSNGAHGRSRNSAQLRIQTGTSTPTVSSEFLNETISEVSTLRPTSENQTLPILLTTISTTTLSSTPKNETLPVPHTFSTLETTTASQPNVSIHTENITIKPTESINSPVTTNTTSTATTTSASTTIAASTTQKSTQAPATKSKSTTSTTHLEVPSESPVDEATHKAITPSQLNVGEDTTIVHEGPTLDPLLAGLVSAFIIAAVIITLLLFLKLRRRDSRPEFRRLQDLPMDDMMEDTPLSMYSY